MESSKGLIVRSIAGHDKGEFQVIIEYNEKYVFICDGKKRPLEKPKRKNLKHLQLTSKILSENQLFANKLIREALKRYRQETNN